MPSLMEIRCVTRDGQKTSIKLPSNSKAQEIIDRIKKSNDVNILGSIFGRAYVQDTLQRAQELKTCSTSSCGNSEPISLDDEQGECSEKVTKRLSLKERAQLGCVRMVCARKDYKELDPERTLDDQGVTDQTEILLFSPTAVAESSIKANDGNEDNFVVTREMIEKATDHIASRHMDTQDPKPAGTPPVQILAVLSALRDTGKKIKEALAPPQDSAEKMDVASDVTDPYKDVDMQAVANIVAMGFQEHHVKKALVISGMNVEAAMEYLITHAEDPSLDEPLKPLPRVPTAAGSSFTPNATYFQWLLDMGFPQESVLAALEIAHNNFQAACELLVQRGDDVVALLESQKTNSDSVTKQVLEELLKDARIHAGLADEHVRQALDAMVENPHSTATYMHDDTIRPLLLLVSHAVANRSI
eukprot:m.55207 g.55207  ORF g.55207 m.55207 type:complete len:416 (+) comp10974_c0_seq4:299-1546(+)